MGNIEKVNKINIRGIFFDNVTMAEAESRAKKFISNKERTLPNVIYTPNSEIVQACIENPDLLPVINSASMIVPDGAGVVLASKILKNRIKEKVAGADLSVRILNYLNEKKGRLFLLGSKKEILEIAIKKLNEQYKNLVICGYNDGYFNTDSNSKENDEVINKINVSTPDVVYVCFGAPKQEKWIYENKSKLNTNLLIGLGGTIDTIAGTMKRAPHWMIKLNLEWFYRLLKQPKRVVRMAKIPKFLFGCIINGNSEA